MVVSQEKDRAIAAYYQVLNPANAGWLRLKLTGLIEEMPYKVTIWDQEEVLTGSQLMYAGIPIDRVRFSKDRGDFASVLIMIEKAVK
jgi:alpha-galactosidase